MGGKRPKNVLCAPDSFKESLSAARAAAAMAVGVRQADAAIDRMVSTDNSNPAAFLARYQYHAHYTTIGSESDLATAFKLDPENSDVLLANGQSHLQQGVTSLSEDQAGDANEHFLQAARCFGQVVETEPTDGRGHLGLGNVLLAQGKSKLAVEAFRSGSKRSNKHSFDSLLRL
ncbi:MAG: glycerate kinase, partial [Planctomycetes bacterium]|nr:glycerate kinase [Planctomycetota bacterium]